MQLKAVLIARVLGFVELATLNPQGRIFFPNIVSGIVGRFNFQKYPTTHEEFDESKGIEFMMGSGTASTCRSLPSTTMDFW